MASLTLLCQILALCATGLFPGLASAQFGRLRPASSSNPNVDPCPARCSTVGPDPAKWPAYQKFDQIQACKHTLFYEFSLYDRVDDPSTPHRIFTCTSYGADWDVLPNSTVSSVPAKVVDATYEIGWWHGGGGLAAGEIQVLSKQVRQYLASGYKATDRPAILFSQLGKGTVGVYVGKALQNEGVGSAALKALGHNIPSLGNGTASVGMQLCKPGDDADHIFGFVASSNASFTLIQEAIKSWSSAECLSFHETKNITGPAFVASQYDSPANSTNVAGNRNNSSSAIIPRRP